MKYIFAFGKDQEYGFSGWIPKFMPYESAVTGQGAAHDILEHGLNDKGTVESELMALGVSHYIRGEQGYYGDIGNTLPPSQHLAHTMSDMLEILFNRGRNLADPGRTLRLEDYTEDDFTEAAERSLVLFENEFKLRMDLEDEQAYGTLSKSETKERLIGWLRKGYRKGQARFKSHDPYSVKQLFHRISKEADRYMKHAEEGDQLEVRLNLKGLDANILHRPYYELQGAW